MPPETLTLLFAEGAGDGADLSELAAQHGGRGEPVAGSGRLAAFRSATGAVDCAVALQRAGAQLRIGLHAADLDGELRGPAVAAAARICALAGVGEILAAGVVASLAAPGDGIWFEAPREVELRGLRGRHPVHPVRWEQSPSGPQRVVVADDAPLVREGIAALLREHSVDVVATVGDAESLLVAVAEHQPDVAIVDIRMPPSFTNEGLVAAERIRAEHPRTGILVLSQHVDPAYATRLLRDGGARSGYLLKERVADAEVLLDAVRRVGRGGSVVDRGLSERLVGAAQARGGLGELTDREREVLALVAEGLSNAAVAERLVVAARTVETHVRQIFLKLGLQENAGEHRRVAAVVAYLRVTGAE